MTIIDFLKNLLLAIVQGIAEVLPISSSGHLAILQTILGTNGGLTFSIYLHFGSLVAMIVYYRKDIGNILKNLWNYLFKKDRSEEAKFYCRLFILLVIASIPAAIVGVGDKVIEKITGVDIIDTYLSNLYFVFAFLAITGTLCLLNNKFKGEGTLKDLTKKDALLIGCFQGVGVLPGISRSGSTIFGGKVRKLSSEEAAHFSFLMFLPVTAGSFLLEVIGNREAIANEQIEVIVCNLICVAFAGVITFLSVKYLFKIIKKGKLHYFAYYCYAVAIIGIILCLCLGYRG